MQETREPQADALKAVCLDILRITQTYHEQMAERGYIGTPGGLEHMGDVWSMLLRWEKQLLPAQEPPHEK